MEWLSWGNAAYMAAIIIGGGLTLPLQNTEAY